MNSTVYGHMYIGEVHMSTRMYLRVCELICSLIFGVSYQQETSRHV